MSDIQIVKVIEQGPQGAPAPEDVLAQVQGEIDAATAAVAAYRTDAVTARNASQSSQYASERARDQAQAAALTATSAYGLLADSTTSLAIATGDKTFTVPAGKAFAPGMPVRASSKANPDTQAMIGVVKSYSGSSLIIAVASVIGAATRADWTIAVTGGALAPIGATRDAQALVQQARLERSLVAAGVAEEPSLILDFIRGVHYAAESAATASLVSLIAALGGISAFTRSSTATYFDSDGLLKTAAIGVPRIEYDPVSRLPRGLLFENLARTNLVTYSEQLDNAAWTKTRSSVTANATAAPDGLTTADKLVEDGAASNTHTLSRTVTATAATAHACSGFVKAAERTEAFVQMANAGGSYTARIDLAAGTIVQASVPTGDWTAGSVAIQSCGNGFYRFDIAATIGATANFTMTVGLRAAGSDIYTGDGVSGLYLWGLQVEAAGRASSYIPTGASTVTRAVDALTIGGGRWIDSTAISALVEFRLNGARSTGVSSPIFLRNAALTSHVRVREGTDIGGADLTASSTTPQIDSSSYPTPLATTMRFAFGIDAMTWSFAKDNVLSFTGGATMPPVGLDRMLVGDGGFHGHISRILIYPKRLTNAKLQALTNQSLWS